MLHLNTFRGKRVTVILIGGALAAIASLSGCTGSREQRTFCDTDRERAADTHPSQHVIVVVGNVANAPRPELTNALAEDLEARVLANARIDIISTAGTGFLCTSEMLGIKPVGSPDQVNDQARKSNARDDVKRILKELTTAPRTDGADLYSALQLAGDQLVAEGAERRLVVILSSGLNDQGYLDYTLPGALGTQVDETLSFLESAGPLPSLEGADVVATGLGYTSEPQEKLRPIDRQQVVETYTAVLQASGAAAVTIDPRPLNGPVVDTLGKSVETVTVEEIQGQQPSIEACQPRTEVFTQASAVRFNPSEATFVDEDATRAALEPVVAWLSEDPRRSVEISGTTARWGTEEEQVLQGQQRAQAVSALLQEGGVAGQQIGKVVGLGSNFPEYQNDLDASGRQIPAAASLNRSIRLTLQETC